MTTDTETVMERLTGKFTEAGLRVEPCPRDYLPGDEDSPLGYLVSVADLAAGRGVVAQLVEEYRFEYARYYDNRGEQPDGYLTLVYQRSDGTTFVLRYYGTEIRWMIDVREDAALAWHPYEGQPFEFEPDSGDPDDRRDFRWRNANRVEAYKGPDCIRKRPVLVW